VLVDGVDVGLEQVRRGYAWHYVKYANEQPAQARLAYAQAEERARAQRVGLWAVAVPIAPWDYRRERAAEAH
jgi:endonuclease YncB( thermonuclease family)